MTHWLKYEAGRRRGVCVWRNLGVTLAVAGIQLWRSALPSALNGYLHLANGVSARILQLQYGAAGWRQLALLASAQK